MMCSNCGKGEANFIYTEIINGVKKEIKLCTKCADKLGFLDKSFNMPSLDFSNFFGEFLNEYDKFSLKPSIFSTKTNALKCNKCGMEYDDFLNNGVFGCANCYNVFENKIDPLLRQLHGDIKYLGKKSMTPNENTENGNIKLTEAETSHLKKQNDYDEINKLKEDLKQAIKIENYEEAASLRDKIKLLEEKEEK